MPIRAAFLLGAMTACGRIGFAPGDVDAADGDAGPCRRSVLDLGAPPASPFQPPVLITELDSSSGDDDPTLTGDELEIYFQTTRGGSQLWRATRATTAVAWSPPTPVDELVGWETNTPEVSRDGLRLRFASNGDVYVTTRPDRASTWAPPVPVPDLNTAANETGVVEFFDGAGLAFWSDRAGGLDLWETLQEPSCVFTTPQILTSQSALAGSNLWMRNDGLVVVFTGQGATGAGDVLVARRPALDAPFGTPVEQTELDSTSVDDDPWLDDAMQSIYFVSARTGDTAIYHATR